MIKEVRVSTSSFVNSFTIYERELSLLANEDYMFEREIQLPCHVSVGTIDSHVVLPKPIHIAGSGLYGTICRFDENNENKELWNTANNDLYKCIHVLLSVYAT